MKNLSILAILAFLAALPAGAAQAPAAKTPDAAPAAATSGPQPKMVLPAPIYDAGKSPQGRPIEHDFEIRNEGAATLEIEHVKPTCGCTVVDFDKSIAPGSTGKLHAAVDTTEFSGPIAKAIELYTNDPGNAKAVLVIKANLEPSVVAEPGYARYIYTQHEPEIARLTQSLWSPNFPDFKVLSVDSPFPYLSVSFHQATDKERAAQAVGPQWQVDTVLSKTAPIGPIAGIVQVHTNHPSEPIVRIPVSGFVRPVLAATPPRANFGERKKADLPVTGNLVVTNFGTAPLQLKSASATIPGVTAEIKPIKEGRRFEVKVTVTPDAPKGPLDGKLEIRSNNPNLPVLEVPLKGKIL